MSAKAPAGSHDEARSRRPHPKGFSPKRHPFASAIGALVLVGSLLRLPHFLVPIWAEGTEFHPFRQAQTLMMIREIMRGGLDFSSLLPVFGPPWVLPMEFPTYQNLAAMVGVGLGVDDVTASRLTTLVTFQASAVLIAILARRLVGPVAAVLALVFWEFGQLLWVWSAAPTIEFLAVFFVMLGMLISLRAAGSAGWVAPALATAAWVLAFLTKFTTALVWMPFLLGVLWIAIGPPRLHVRMWLRACIPVTAGGLVGGVYVLHGDAVKAASPFTEFLTSANLRTWNFGTIDQRLDPQMWDRIAMHANGIVGSSLIFLIVALVALFVVPRRLAILIGSGLVSILGAILLLFNLYVIHDYYLIAVAPILVVIGGAIGQTLIRDLSRRVGARPAAVLTVITMTVLIVLSWALSQGREALEKFVYQEWRYGQSVEIAQSTLPSDGVVVVGCSWSPEILYYADRRGVMLQDSWQPGNLQHKIPSSWVDSAVQYVFLCTEGRAVESLFEESVESTRISDRLYRIERPEA